MHIGLPRHRASAPQLAIRLQGKVGVCLTYMLDKNCLESKSVVFAMHLDGDTVIRYIVNVAVLKGILATLIIYLTYCTLRRRPIPDIPHNQDAAGRVFGDLKSMGAAKYRRQWIWSQPRDHGSVISQILFPFQRPIVIVSDYRETIEICSRRAKEFDRGNRNKECIGIVAPNFHFTMESRDPRLRYHRELLKDLMTPWFLQKIATPRVYENAVALVGLWKLKESKARGRAFPANHDLYLSTQDAICAVAFGMDQQMSAIGQQTRHIERLLPLWPGVAVESVRFPSVPVDAYVESILDIPEMVAIAQKSTFPALSQRLALLHPKHARAHWNRRALIRKQTERALRRMSSLGEKYTPQSALDHLLHREKMVSSRLGRNPDFFSPIIRDEILGYLLGGHDTTATVLSWWTKHMQCFQHVQFRLRQSLHQAYPEAVKERRSPTAEEIASLSVPYLDAVVEESLRIASVVALISRTTTCDTHILGHKIPKGTNVLLTLTGPSITQAAIEVPESRRTSACRETKDRIPPWGDDIEEYKPERWLKIESGENGEEMEVFDPHAGPNLAFSTGLRQCFGKKLALLQLKTTMVLLVWDFDFQEVDDSLSGWDITERLVNLPKNCHVKLKRKRRSEEDNEVALM
ncbi:hypothetical protein ED733_008393 [Metarhizium rileyi]|uniref:Cytochrome P450 monooxygenase n=1 Tax=Metarhizium rileyi (strain RCEF 4871) TaxID=1649241 RepID=A0A5C6GL03_METRR|nr:hypothetical protein ED733_008393 [Metarhizium rileyi]